MKRIAFAALASLFILASCRKKSDEGTHTHADGRTHANHSDTTKTNAADSTVQDSTAHGHSHEH